MDLIDFQTCADGEFKWLLVYQDHFTKLVQLRPIRAKSAIEVATALFDNVLKLIECYNDQPNINVK